MSAVNGTPRPSPPAAVLGLPSGAAAQHRAAYVSDVDWDAAARLRARVADRLEEMRRRPGYEGMDAADERALAVSLLGEEIED